MSLPARVSSQLGKLIPRLGSSFDAEVAATARAIGRTLASAGRDWHDLARAICAVEAAPQPSLRSGPPQWRNLSPGERIMAMDAICSLRDLSPWERTFVASIEGKLRRNRLFQVTARQAAVLDDLLA